MISGRLTDLESARVPAFSFLAGPLAHATKPMATSNTLMITNAFFTVSSLTIFRGGSMIPSPRGEDRNTAFPFFMDPIRSRTGEGPWFLSSHARVEHEALAALVHEVDVPHPHRLGGVVDRVFHVSRPLERVHGPAGLLGGEGILLYLPDLLGKLALELRHLLGVLSVLEHDVVADAVAP